MSTLIATLGGIRASIFACLFLATLGALCIQTARWDQQQRAWLREKLAASQALAQALAQQRDRERKQAAEMAAIGERYEQDKAAAQAVELDVVNGLRAGTLRLRQSWSRCEQQRLSQTSAGASGRDAPSADGAALAAAIVRVGRDADDQIKACQAVIVSGGHE